jgi:hypothetical protein
MTATDTQTAADLTPMTVSTFREIVDRIEEEVSTVMVGQANIVRDVLICLIGGGHALLEGVPGLGKTMLVRTLSEALDLQFSRIQFTPDLMPADITGTNILLENQDGSRQFAFQPGPIFANLVLADEINRATPKTQSPAGGPARPLLLQADRALPGSGGPDRDHPPHHRPGHAFRLRGRYWRYDPRHGTTGAGDPHFERRD